MAHQCLAGTGQQRQSYERKTKASRNPKPIDRVSANGQMWRSGGPEASST